MKTTTPQETPAQDYNSIVKALSPPIETQSGIRPRFIYVKEGHEAAKVYDLWHVDPDDETQGIQKKCILNAKFHLDAKTITLSLNQEMISARRRQMERNGLGK